MKLEIIDKMLSSSNCDDIILGIEYLIKLKKKDVEILIPSTNLSGYDDDIGEYRYSARGTSLRDSENFYVSKGLFKILVRDFSIMTCNISAERLKKWGWKKKKS